jgi:hypothetical protein
LEGGRKVPLMQVIERFAEHYEVEEMPFGRDYKWSPEQVILKCSKCGKRRIYKRSQVIGSEVIRCECGKGNTARIREELVIKVLDEEYEAHHHPWRYWHTTKDSGIPA